MLSKAKEFCINPYHRIYYTPSTYPPKTTQVPEQQLSFGTRYKQYIETIHELIHNKIEQSTYENRCTQTFGVKSYILFTMDRIILFLGKQLQNISNSESTIKITTVFNQKVSFSLFLKLSFFKLI